MIHAYSVLRRTQAPYVYVDSDNMVYEWQEPHPEGCRQIMLFDVIDPVPFLLKGSVYLHLFHGRNHPDEQLDDWGFDGPKFGPVKWYHTTYHHHIRFGLEFFQDGVDLVIDGDMVCWRDKWFGDWSVYKHE